MNKNSLAAHHRITIMLAVLYDLNIISSTTLTTILNRWDHHE